MKKSILLFLLSTVASFGLFAQNITIDPISITTTPTADITDAEAHLDIVNTATTTKTYKWERTVLQISPNCKTQVCDPNLCYLSSVSSKEFELTAGETAKIIVHFLNPTGAVACAKVEIKLTEVGNATNTVTGTYIFNDCSVVLETKDFVKNNIKFYPNPVVESFQLENATDIAQLHVTAMDGRTVKSFHQITGESTFSVAELTQGTYYLVMEDKNGKTIKVLNFEKH
jgi:Secretion system C-terminal sorting domain